MAQALMDIVAAIHEARSLGIQKTQYQLLAAMPAIEAALRLGYKHTQIHALLSAKGIEWNLNYYRVLFNRAKGMAKKTSTAPQAPPPADPPPGLDFQETRSTTNQVDEDAAAQTLVFDELARARSAGSVDYTRKSRRGIKK